jgi:hypothetical protein
MTALPGCIAHVDAPSMNCSIFSRLSKCWTCRLLPMLDPRLFYAVHIFVYTWSAPPKTIGGAVLRLANEVHASYIVVAANNQVQLHASPASMSDGRFSRTGACSSSCALTLVQTTDSVHSFRYLQGSVTFGRCLFTPAPVHNHSVIQPAFSHNRRSTQCGWAASPTGCFDRRSLFRLCCSASCRQGPRQRRRGALRLPLATLTAASGQRLRCCPTRAVLVGPSIAPRASCPMSFVAE